MIMRNINSLNQVCYLMFSVCCMFAASAFMSGCIEEVPVEAVDYHCSINTEMVDLWGAQCEPGNTSTRFERYWFELDDSGMYQEYRELFIIPQGSSLDSCNNAHYYKIDVIVPWTEATASGHRYVIGAYEIKVPDFDGKSRIHRIEADGTASKYTFNPMNNTFNVMRGGYERQYNQSVNDDLCE